MNAELYDTSHIYLRNIEFYVVDGILDRAENIKNKMGDYIGPSNDYDKIIWFKVSKNNNNAIGLHYGEKQVDFVGTLWDF